MIVSPIWDTGRMKGKMNRSKLQRTPKVFATSYRPPARTSRGQAPSHVIKNWRPIIIVVGIVVLSVLVARLPLFQVKSVTISGITNAELRAEIEAFNGKSIFSSQIGRTTSKWLSRDPSLAELICRRGLPDSVTCTGKTRTGVLVWKRNGAEYWVDADGRAFAARNPAEPASLVIEDRVGEVGVGVDVASREIVDTYIRLQQRLSERAIVVKNIVVADALYQPTVVISAFPGPNAVTVQKEITALFVATESVDAQVKTLVSLLGSRGQLVADRVDVRVPGYIYYH